VTGRNTALAFAAMEDRNWKAASDYAKAAIEQGFKPGLEILAIAAWRSGDLRAALDALEAMEDRGETATAMLARLHLLIGDHKRGWTLVLEGCRSGMFGPPLYDLPRWNGENLAGRRVVAWGIGLGDDIFFARFLPTLAVMGAEIHVNCRPALLRLFKTIPGVADVQTIYNEISGAEFQIQPGELPALFEAHRGEFWAAAPYFHAEPSKRVERTSGVGRVGIVWAADVGHWEAQDRTVALASMAPLATAAAVHFFSLQFGRSSAQLNSPPAGMRIDDFGQGDFAQAAGVIAAMDVVITIDTAIANLAGALHVPVWVAVPFVADWRWGATGHGTPWYPTARIYRQPSPGDWASVFQRMASDLSATVWQ
jgi:hypothetical protein